MDSSTRIIKSPTDAGVPPHPEIVLAFDPEMVIPPDVDWLENVLSQQMAAGSKFKPGQTIQLGWLFLKVFEKGTRLVLAEPNFAEIPMKFVPTVGRGLMQLRLQKSVAESVGLAERADFPSPLQACLTCARLNDRVDFVMERFDKSGNDSGWYLGCDNADHDHNDAKNLARRSLYEVACYRPECIPFLAL